MSATQAPYQPQPQYPQPQAGAPVQSSGCVCPTDTPCGCNDQYQQPQQPQLPPQQYPQPTQQQPVLDVNSEIPRE